MLSDILYKMQQWPFGLILHVIFNSVSDEREKATKVNHFSLIMCILRTAAGAFSTQSFA